MNSSPPQLTTFRIIFFALVAGVVLFGGVILSITSTPRLVWPPSMLSIVLAGVGIVIAIQGLVLPAVIRRNRPAIDDSNEDEVERLSRHWGSSSLVGIALLESASFVNLIGLLVEGNLLHLVIAGACVVLMFVHYPGRNRILDWIEQR